MPSWGDTYAMGLFDKLLRGADRIHDAKTDAEHAIFRDRSFEKAERLAESGESHAAVITGIRGRYNDSTSEVTFRLEWDDGRPRVAAVLFKSGAPDGLRLGCEVLVVTDGSSTVLDTVAMGTAPAVGVLPGRVEGRVPEPGVDDRAQDLRVLNQLKRWAPERGVIETWTRRRMLGLPTDSWNIVIRRADGSSATVSGVEVPTYARWFVRPSAEVPIVVDPDDASKAQLDWPTLAVERSGGGWHDEPPTGSIAADLPAPPSGAVSEGSSMAAEVDLTVSETSAEAIEGVTIERWARIEAALTQARVTPADYDSFAETEFGVAPGRWTVIAKAWNERMRGDWRVGAAFGEAFEAAQRDLKKKR